jgi:hypothetical protein
MAGARPKVSVPLSRAVERTEIANGNDPILPALNTPGAIVADGFPTGECLRVSLVMGRHALNAFGQEIIRR